MNTESIFKMETSFAYFTISAFIVIIIALLKNASSSAKLERRKTTYTSRIIELVTARNIACSIGQNKDTGTLRAFSILSVSLASNNIFIAFPIEANIISIGTILTCIFIWKNTLSIFYSIIIVADGTKPIDRL